MSRNSGENQISQQRSDEQHPDGRATYPRRSINADGRHSFSADTIVTTDPGTVRKRHGKIERCRLRQN